MTASLLNIGSSALAAAQASIATTSHNIANVNTAGYSRQEAVLQTAGGQYTGSGFFGNGVQVDTVRRIYDAFLAKASQSASATSQADQVRAQGLNALDSLFADPDTGVGAAVDALFSAAGDLAARPSDLSTRQAFVSSAASLATRLSSLGSQIVSQQADADTQLKTDATQVNSQIADIARLNGQIALAQSTGQAPNDLLDQRDAALQTLNSLIETHSVAQSDGTINLFTANGAPLLVGSSASQLNAVPDPSDASHLALSLTVAGQTQWMDRSSLGGGALGGLITLRDVDLQSALDETGRLAQVISSAVNGQQALGVDMNGQPGAPIFSTPSPQTIPDSRNTGAATLSASIVDASALQARDYTVAWDGSNYNITRTSDGQTTSFASLPATLDGVSFASSGAPANGDRWTVRPTAPAATAFQALTVSPRQVATGYAASVQPAAGNTGSVQAAQFDVVRSDPANAQAVSIVFNNPPTTVNITGLASGNLTNVPYTPGQPMPPAPADYNGWRITLDGTPAAGDAFNVGPNPSPAADNRNALALGTLASQPLVDGATINDAYANLIADVGLRTQSAQDNATVSQAIEQDATTRQQSASGVNLDEEAANLLRFQQAYQASAKIIQASQTLFDALLAATATTA